MDSDIDRKLDNQSIRLSIAAAALAEVGENDSLKYWSAVVPRHWNIQQLKSYSETKSWCGGFALWCLKQAGLAENIFWKDGLGFLLVSPHSLSRTSEPETGDIAYFDRNQHHAVVCHINEDSTVRLVNGNGEGGKVTVTDTPINNVTAFFSIKSLLPADST